MVVDWCWDDWDWSRGILLLLEAMNAKALITWAVYMADILAFMGIGWRHDVFS